MTTRAATQPVTCAPSHGVLVLSGYGLRMAVERGHLVTEDGIGANRRRQRYARVGSGLRRIVITGSHGAITLDALHWLYEVGVSFLHIGPDAEIIALGGPRALDDVKLRRAQVRAGSNGHGVALAKRLARGKLEGQMRVLPHLPHGEAVASRLAALLPVLDVARTYDRIRYLEAKGAAAYWQCWERVPITFAKREQPKIPQHWLRVGPRQSGISQGPIKATSPAHAILNYLYAILEAEAALALRAVGCDPALGVLHVDIPRRDSLACDVMEPIRPLVDAFVLRLLRERVFLKSDFFERHDGNCRLLPNLSGALSVTGPEWAERLAPHVEDTAAFLLTAKASRTIEPAEDEPLPTWIPRLVRTPLTGRNRSRRFRPIASRRLPDLALLPLARRCASCGLDMGYRDRAYCDDCLSAATRERAAKQLQSPAETRSLGVVSQRSAHTVAKLRRRTTEQMRLSRAWEEQHSGRPSASIFYSEITPRLKAVPLPELARAMGFSTPFCKALRSGRSAAHPRHWPRLTAFLDRYERDHPGAAAVDLTRPDSSIWRRDIEPHLKSLGAAIIREVTGLSHSYARRILHGRHIPRPQHWAALLQAVRQRKKI